MTRDLQTNLIKALVHPTRRQILKTMAKHSPISPRQLSGQIGEPLSNVGYHVRVLAANDLVQLVDEVPVGGSMQHFYRMTLEEPWALGILGIENAE